ncbi:MAG: T9SS type A sorting domain-containing protein [Calditrichota bacterium]
MRYVYRTAIFFFMLLTTTLFAQNEVLNPGFENWTAGQPDNWVTTNVPNLVTNITQSSDAFTGNSSLKGEIGTFQGNPFGPSIQASQGFGAPILNITKNYTQLTGYYKVNITPGTVVVVISTLIDANSGQVATMVDTLSVSATDWTQFTLDYDYSNGSGGQATQATIQIALGSDGGGFQIGDYYLVDDIALVNPVGIEPIEENGVVNDFQLSQNYPNPFNPTTNIKFSIPTSEFVTLTIHNILGIEVARLVNEQLTAGSYVVDWNAADLPSGTYLYTLSTANQQQTRKLMLLK